MFQRQLFSLVVVKRFINVSSSRCSASVGRIAYENHKIGLREIVGFGINGIPEYKDSVTFPFPAIRFQEISPCFKGVKEKEKGDWKSLSKEEKKLLYRISFCQTFAEIEAPTGEWKTVIGFFLTWVSLSIVMFGIVKHLTREPLPKSMNEDRREIQLKRILAFRMNPIDGLSSKYDYEKSKWK